MYRPRPDSPWYQVGIVSFGTRQCGTGQPGVYTRLSPFISWIQSHLEAWNEKKCNFWTQDKNNLTYKCFVLFLFRWTSFPVILRSLLDKVGYYSGPHKDQFICEIMKTRIWAMKFKFLDWKKISFFSVKISNLRTEKSLIKKRNKKT